MGWTSYHAKYYTKNGRVDRKKECDAYWTEGLNRGNFRIEKSALVGTVYYAAVTPLMKSENGNAVPIPPEEQETWCVVFLTSTDGKSYYNFSYKDMDETMEPYSYDCPKSVLDCLTPTENEAANRWRAECRKRSEHRSDKAARLRKLPIGAKIEFTDREGNLHRFSKCPACFQFKKPFWMNGDYLYIKIKNIPDDFRVVEA